ncbi:hypothetical protein ACSU64_27620, partial [Bacillaceae bacterium C204]|uniref:hypothetical protein n=1 Tax=Neobacillus sp. 204 TaxID=3383351 RepID=UPI00397C16DB
MKKISELLHIPVRINQRQIVREDRDTELILQNINRFTLEPFRSLDELYLFSGICSNNRLDSYMTKMDESSLKNYAQN